MAEALVLHGGKVVTADPARPRAEAVGIRGERIVAVGGVDEVRAAVGPGAGETDCDGATVLPGFIDAHNHFVATAESMAALDARYPKVASVDDLVRLVGEAVQCTPSGRWIRAFGMDHAKLPGGRAPTRFDLDVVAPDHPVAVHHVSGHHVLVNTAAMALAGVGEGVADVPGGGVVRDEEGRATGLFLDAATGLVVPSAVDIGCHGPNFHTARSLSELVDEVDAAGHEYLAAGLTSVCDAQVTSRELTAYREARRQGRLHVRTFLMPLSHQLPDLLRIGLAGPFGDDRLAVVALKLYADGSLIGGTAAFTEPYGERGEFEGSLYHRPEDLAAMIRTAHGAGWQVGVHAQGDRAMGIVIDAFREALAEHPRGVRHRIEHAGYPTPEQVRRMADLGIFAVAQPSYLRDSGDEFLARLGPRAERLQPLRELLEAGVGVVLSSDADVASYRPLDTIAAAVRRRTLEEREIGAAQALTVEEAVSAHTLEPAVALGMDDRLGSLSAGKLADVVVLEGDLLGAPPEAIPEMKVRTTILGGEVVYRAPAA